MIGKNPKPMVFPGTFLGDIGTELSDVILAQSFQQNEVMNLTVGNLTCQARLFGGFSTDRI